YGDERPIENPIDRRSRHKDKKGWRQGKVKDEAVEGCGRVRPKYPEVPRKIARQYDAKDRKDDIYKSVHGTSFPRELGSTYIANWENAMSALGHKQTYAAHKLTSALPPIATAKADIGKPSCPLYPQKRTCAVHMPMSAMGQ